jgi:hypothetical protein
MSSKKQPVTKKETTIHQSPSNAKFLHVPNGQMLRGVQIQQQSGGGYQIPHSSDVFTFSTKKRIKK